MLCPKESTWLYFCQIRQLYYTHSQASTLLQSYREEHFALLLHLCTLAEGWLFAALVPRRTLHCTCFKGQYFTNGYPCAKREYFLVKTENFAALHSLCSLNTLLYLWQCKKPLKGKPRRGFLALQSEFRKPVLTENLWLKRKPHPTFHINALGGFRDFWNPLKILLILSTYNLHNCVIDKMWKIPYHVYSSLVNNKGANAWKFNPNCLVNQFNWIEKHPFFILWNGLIG